MIRIDAIEPSILAVPFKVAFRHASAERSAMQSLWVEARSGDLVGHGEGCPREYVTGESLASAREFVEVHRSHWMRAIGDLASMRQYLDEARSEIDANPAAWSAVELALLDLMGKARGLTVERLIGVPELGAPLRYSAVLGDAAPDAFAAQLAHYLRAGLRDFKIKLSGNSARDAAKVEALRASGIDARAVRADANNLFVSAHEAIAHLCALQFPFFAIEEPLRVGDYDGMRRIARALGTQIILDESALRLEQLEALSEDAETWIVNLRISKMGGLLRSVDFVREAERLGIRLVVGAHVGETSVLTRAGITVANFARNVLVAQEGAFGTHLLERDVVDSPIMFGPGGALVLDGRFANAGLGIAVKTD